MSGHLLTSALPMPSASASLVAVPNLLMASALNMKCNGIALETVSQPTDTGPALHCFQVATRDNEKKGMGGRLKALRLERFEHDPRWTQDYVAKAVGTTKANISKIEGKPKTRIDLEVFFALADLYQVDARELATGKSTLRVAEPQGELELTPTERTIGRIWGQLPSVAQEYFAASIQNAFRLMEEDRDVAARIWTQPDPKRTADIERRIEAYQLTHRGSKTK